MNDLSSDQRLLLEYVRGVSAGEVNPRYASWKIGPLNHARWLTLAIRILSLYVKGQCPPESTVKLRTLVEYIVSTYAVSWFEIKRDSKFHNQPKYLYSMIERIKVQKEEVKNVGFNN